MPFLPVPDSNTHQMRGLGSLSQSGYQFVDHASPGAVSQGKFAKLLCFAKTWLCAGQSSALSAAQPPEGRVASQKARTHVRGPAGAERVAQGASAARAGRARGEGVRAGRASRVVFRGFSDYSVYPKGSYCTGMLTVSKRLSTAALFLPWAPEHHALRLPGKARVLAREHCLLRLLR